jgi:hypothetical protein
MTSAGTFQRLKRRVALQKGNRRGAVQGLSRIFCQEIVEFSVVCWERADQKSEPDVPLVVLLKDVPSTERKTRRELLKRKKL